MFGSVSPQIAFGQLLRWRIRTPTLSLLAHAVMTTSLFLAIIVTSISTGPVDLWDHPLAAALIILILGVPHGACDVAILKKRWQIKTPQRFAAALAGYIALAIVTLVAWFLVPALCLGGFLLISAYHFANDWPVVSGASRRLCVGCALLAATTFFHRSDVGDIFSWLAVDRDGPLIASVMQVLAAPLLIGTIGIAAGHYARFPIEMTELGACITAAVILPPLTFFVAYFCCLHSVRHLIGVRMELAHQSPGAIALDAAPYAVAAVIGTVIGGSYLGTHDLGHDLVAAVFVSLAALTVPHMMLVRGE